MSTCIFLSPLFLRLLFLSIWHKTPPFSPPSSSICDTSFWALTPPLSSPDISTLREAIFALQVLFINGFHCETASMLSSGEPWGHKWIATEAFAVQISAKKNSQVFLTRGGLHSFQKGLKDQDLKQVSRQATTLNGMLFLYFSPVPSKKC